MIFEVNDIEVARGAGARLEAAFADVRRLLLQVPGCRSAELLRDLETPGRYQVRVAWEKLADHVETYPATSQAVEIRALLAPLVARIERRHCAPVSPGQAAAGAEALAGSSIGRESITRRP